MLFTWFDPNWFPLISLGVGGMLLVWVVWLTRNPASSLAAPVTWITAGAIFLGLLFSLTVWLVGWPATFWAPPLVLAVLYFLLVFLPSPVALASVQRAVRWGRLPIVRLFLMATLMFAAVLSAMAISFSSLEPVELFHSNEVLAGHLANDGVDLVEVAGATATTDQGNMVRVAVNKSPSTDHLDPVRLKNQFAMLAQKGLRDQVIHLACAWQNTNCHGWVFAGGHFWITGNEVDLILMENGYQEVALPVAGDLVVYRGVDNGSVTHSGIVRYVGNGSVLVESKWGRLGRFIHPHHKHCYGDDTCHFYRSSRQGHLLLGLPLETDFPSLPYRDVVETYKHTAPPASSLPIP